MEVGFKPHAACRYAHGPIDLAQTAYRADGVRLANGREGRRRHERARHPAGVEAGLQQSQRRHGQHPVRRRARARGGRQRAARSTGTATRTPTSTPARNTIELRRRARLWPRRTASDDRYRSEDGRTVTPQFAVEPKGEPSNPLSADDLEAKFLAMTTMVIDRAHAQQHRRPPDGARPAAEGRCRSAGTDHPWRPIAARGVAHNEM